ncbi:MAG: HRDC domain-containing protein [Spirochaetales bacterium]|nr:HRDC domain-containing protein [Spirochaetales bacterium]
MGTQEFQLIDTQKGYRRLLERLRERQVREIALDLEGESNLHVYGVHLCLVQVYDAEACYLVDPLGLEDPREIAALTENVDLLKVMYDPSSDLSLLTNALGTTVKNIFDLSTAAQVLGHRETGLSKVLAAELGVEPVNKKKFQKANWCRRPLERELLGYAANDVLHLLELKRVFLRRLLERDLLTEFLVQNYKVQHRDYFIDPSTRHLRLKNAARLNRVQQVYLKYFFAAREALARKLNWPPHNVLANERLLEIAQDPPTGRSAWEELGRHGSRRVELEGFPAALAAAEAEVAAAGRESSGSRARRPTRRPRRGPTRGPG